MGWCTLCPARKQHGVEGRARSVVAVNLLVAADKAMVSAAAAASAGPRSAANSAAATATGPKYNGRSIYWSPHAHLEYGSLKRLTRLVVLAKLVGRNGSSQENIRARSQQFQNITWWILRGQTPPDCTNSWKGQLEVAAPILLQQLGLSLGVTWAAQEGLSSFSSVHCKDFRLSQILLICSLSKWQQVVDNAQTHRGKIKAFKYWCSFCRSSQKYSANDDRWILDWWETKLPWHVRSRWRVRSRFWLRDSPQQFHAKWFWDPSHTQFRLQGIIYP